MGNSIIKKAKTVEKAIELACLEFGVNTNDVTFEVLQLPKKSFLGLKNTLAEVKITLISGRGDNYIKNQEEKKPISKEQFKLVLDNLLDYLKNILSKMDVNDLLFVIKETDDIYIITIDPNQCKMANIIIEKNGEILLALQHLSNVFINKMCVNLSYPRVSLNFKGYQELKQRNLEILVNNVAKVVIKTGKNSTLEPMSNYDRFIVHNIVKNVPGISSKSIGERNERRIVIYPRNVK